MSYGFGFIEITENVPAGAFFALEFVVSGEEFDLQTGERVGEVGGGVKDGKVV